GGTVGLGVALLFGGMLAEAYGWRAPIIMIGVLGLLLAIPAWRYLPEPRRAASARGEIEAHAMPLAQALRFMLGQPAYRWLMVAGGAAGFGMFSLLAWTPSFFQRVHGWSPGEVGAALAVVMVVPGLVGSLASGKLADRWLDRDRGAHCWIPAVSLALAIPFLLSALLAPAAFVALAALTFVHLL